MVTKLHLMTMAGVFSAMTMSAQTPELKWMSAQDGEGTESPLQVKAAHDGNVLMLSDFDSSAKEGKSRTTDFWHYDLTSGEKISAATLTGAPETQSANGAKALSFYKVSATDGHMMWAINTTLGDGAGKGAITATADGGALMALKMRHSAKDLSLAPDVLCQFVDMKGDTTTVNWTAPGASWVYQPVLVKVSAEGAIEWAKHVEATGDFEIQDVTADANGIYVAGCYMNELNWGEKANLKTTNTKGDVYVVKLNQKGEAVWNATATGAVNAVKAYRLALDGDKLFVTGWMKGDGSSKLAFGKTELVPSALKDLFVAGISTTDGSFAWASALTGAKNATAKQEIKTLALTVAGNDLYIGGSFTGDMLNGADVFLSNNDDKFENAYVLKCNATDGTFQNGLRIRPSEKETPMYIGQVQSIHVYGDEVLATGYVMATSTFLYHMDRDLTAESMKADALATSASGSSFGSVLTNDMLVTTVRAKATAVIPGFNHEYNTIGSWSCILTAHNLKKDEQRPEDDFRVDGNAVLSWLSAQDGEGTECPLMVKASRDGNVFMLSDFDSSAKEGASRTTDFWHYDIWTGEKTSEATLTGAPETKSANGAKALSFYKINSTDGHMMWSINTTLGDGAGKGAITATADGGAILALKMRHTTKDLSLSSDVLCQFVDMKGDTTTVNWTAPGTSWVYQPVLVKVNAEGAIEWAKHVEATGDFEIQDVTADADGIYVAGCYMNELNWGEKANLKTTNTKGDVYVVKLNQKGEAVWNATATGAVNAVKAYRLALDGDKLFVAGWMKGDGNSKLAFGKTELVPSALKDLFVAGISTTDGSFTWASALAGAKNATAKQEIKTLALTVAGNDLYIGGSFTGDMLNGADVFLSNNDDKFENAYVLKCNATDGTFQNGLRIRPSEKETPMYIGQVQSIHVKNGKVLATGYVMATSTFLYRMDTDLNAASMTTDALVTSASGTSFGSVLVNGKLITATRAKATATFPNMDLSYNTIGSWSCVLTGHNLDGELTGIENNETVANELNVAVVNGGLVADAAAPSQLRVYSLSGVMMFNGIVEGRTDIALPSGLYIVNGQKLLVR